MKITTEPVVVLRDDGQPLDTRGFASDFAAIEHEGKILAAMNFPIGNPMTTAIAVCESPVGDGVRFTRPRVVLRPLPSTSGITRGAETPDPLPPGPGFPFWSIASMTYDAIAGRSTDHFSVISLALARAFAGPWTWMDVVMGAQRTRHMPTYDASKNHIEGGLSEPSRIWNGPNLVALVATNSYRPKPAIYVAFSTAPLLNSGWAMSAQPVLEGEGALWASQPHLSVVGGVPTCVYVEGDPRERIVLARGSPDFMKWDRVGVLLEPTPDTPYASRAFGPCLVGNRLYFTAVPDESPGSWRIMTAEVEL